MRFHYHNENGPAFIQYYSNGVKQFEGYCINDKDHREGGPASIDWNEDGSLSEELYFIKNTLHRIDGPACIDYYKNKVEYYYQDKCITAEAFQIINELGISDNHNDWTPEHKQMFTLHLLSKMRK